MMNLKEIQEGMEKLKDWSLESGILVKDMMFENFKQALEYVNKVGEIAEKHEHHPNIVIAFNRVNLSLTTHKEGGLTNKDFEVAEEIDKI